MGYAACSEQFHEGRQFLRGQKVRYIAHRTGHIERKGNTKRLRMVSAVTALTNLNPLWVHKWVAIPLRKDFRAALVGATAGQGGVRRERVISVSHIIVDSSRIKF